MKAALLLAVLSVMFLTARAFALNNEACRDTGSRASWECQNIAGYLCGAAVSRDAGLSMKEHIETSMQSYQAVGKNKLCLTQLPSFSIPGDPRGPGRIRT